MSNEAAVSPESLPPARPARVSSAPSPETEPRAGSIAVSRVFRAIRRHTGLMLFVTTFTTTFALIVFRQPPLYRASAVMRVVEERRAVTPGIEPGDVDERHVVLVNSLVPRVRSRAVMGAVVDSLGLQLRPVPLFSILRPSVRPSLPLAGIRVDPKVKPDTLTLLFSPESLTVRHGDDSRRAAYGQPITVAGAQFTVTKPPQIAGAVLAVVPRDMAIDGVLTQLAVVPLPGTDAIEVRSIDTDPQQARDIANAVVRTFYSATISSSQELARRRRTFLEEQLKESDRQLGEAQAELTAFRSRRALANTSDMLARQQTELMDLNVRRGDLQADRRVFQSLLGRIQTGNDSANSDQLFTLAYSPEVATDPVVGKLLQQLITYQARLDSLTSGPFQSSRNNPDVLQLRQMVKGTEVEVVRGVRGRLTSIDERLAALRDLHSRNADAIAALPTLEAEESRLAQKVSALSEFSTQVRLEFQRARMSEALAAADIEVVDDAALPYLPTGIPWWIEVGLALVFGLVVGTLLSLALELKNRSIRAPEDIEEVLHLRGLGVIPPVMEAIAAEEARPMGEIGGAKAQAVALRGLVTDSPEWPSVGAEAFRLLYSSLTYGWGERQRTILVTSVAPQEGKTLVVANLGVTFARQGARVLLVDCDIRRPHLHKTFQVSRSPGLAQLLGAAPEDGEPPETDDAHKPLEHAYSMAPGIARDEADPGAEPAGEAPRPTNGNGRKSAPAPVSSSNGHRPRIFRNLRETGFPGLWLLPSGKVERNAPASLNVATFRSMLADLSSDFDVVILDTPPSLASADAVILAPVADDVLLVVRAGHTDRNAAERAHQTLSDAGGNVVGAVLNDPDGKVPHDRLLYYTYGYPVTSD